VVEYLVDYSRVLAGGGRPFDEAAVRELARRDVGRARGFAVARNHDAIAEGERQRGPLLALDGAGHGLDRADWDTVARSIIEHTSIDGARR
jgi:hypothetical protein